MSKTKRFEINKRALSSSNTFMLQKNVERQNGDHFYQKFLIYKLFFNDAEWTGSKRILFLYYLPIPFPFKKFLHYKCPWAVVITFHQVAHFIKKNYPFFIFLQAASERFDTVKCYFKGGENRVF